MTTDRRTRQGPTDGAAANGWHAGGSAAGFASRVQGYGPSLGEFFDTEVRPRLTAELVFTHPAHAFQADGTKLRGGCPWHHSRSGTSFYVDVPTLRWRCPACQAGGGPLQYMHRLAGGTDASPRGEDFVRTVRRACELAGVIFPERELSEEERERARRRETRRAVLATVIVICQERLRSPAGEAARAYLQERGFNDRAVEDLGLGLYPDDHTELRRQLGAAGHDAKDITESAVVSRNMRGYVTFPWNDAHDDPMTLYGTWPAKVPPDGVPKKMTLPNPRSGPEVGEQTKRVPLYFDRARRAGERALVAVEGVTDAAYLQSLGDTRVVAYVGAELSHGQVETLRRHRVRSVVVVPDPDAAGDGGALSCVRQLRDAGITPYVAPRLPDGLDPDEFALRDGLDAWKAHVRRAVHGYRFVARSVLAGQGERTPGDDAWSDAVVGEALAFARTLPRDRDEEMARHFWPEVAAAVGGDPAALRARVREDGPSPTGTDALPGGGPARGAALRQGGPPPDWQPPLPLSTTPPVAPFPLDTLPAPLRAFAQEASGVLACPVDFVAVPLLAVAGGCVGNARRLAIHDAHTQSACLFAAVVGKPGSGKSPALEMVAGPVEKAERRYFDEWRREFAAWKESEDEDKGAAPRLRRCLLDDTTTEAMAAVLKDNRRGLLMVRDEMAALVCGLNQYKGGKGHDRQVYLQLWSQATIRVDRKNHTDGLPVRVYHPFVGIIGGLQPDVVPRLRGDAFRGAAPPDDGFLDRFLFSYPSGRPSTKERWRSLSAESRQHWAGAVEKLLALPMVEEGDEVRPYLMKLAGSGEAAWEAFTERHAAELNDPDFPEHLAGAWAKLRGYGARLALVVHLLRLVCGETDLDLVDGESMGRAAELVAYFKSHARKVYAEMVADARAARARKVLHCLAQNPALSGDPAGFSRRDLHQHLRRTFHDPAELDAPLALLTDLGYLRAVVLDRGGRPGPNPARYVVNPLWTRTQDSQDPRVDPAEECAGGTCGSCESCVRSAAGGRETEGRGGTAP
jgi:hypothetical protein